MESLFLKILNMSITGSYVILFVLAVRLLLAKAPRSFSYALWGIAAFRLLCPVTLESIFSLIPIHSQTISPQIVYEMKPQIQSGVTIIDNTVNHYLPPATPYSSINPLQVYLFIGEIIWILGIFLFLLYSLYSVFCLKNSLKNAMLLKDNIFQIEGIPTAFVFGFINPKIYLPANLSEKESVYIIEHEKTHIKRGDHIIKALAFLLRSIHWFNPLVWIAFCLYSKDMELSCDEAVIKKMGNGIKKDYSQSLLSLSSSHSLGTGCPLAFGESNTKSRIKNVLNYKKPTFWGMIGAVIVLIIVFAGLISNPLNSSEPDLSFLNIDNLISLSSLSDTSDEQISAICPSLYENPVHVTGKAVAQYLNDISWKKLSAKSSYALTADLIFRWNKDLELHFFESKPTLAMVRSGDQRQYYEVPENSYERVQNLISDEYEKWNASANIAAPEITEYPEYSPASEDIPPDEINNAITGSYTEYHPITRGTLSEEEKNNTFLIAENNQFKWLIRPSENVERYNSPFIRYDLIRTDQNTGEILVLDDLLWESSTLMNPIIFTEERLVYTGAKKDEILYLKTPSLISIKHDGSDRKIYDAKYGVTNHLSYDNGKLYYEGWTNDQKFPRPIVRMNDDFTQTQAITEIEGSMLTVYKDCLYYLGNNKNKKSGAYLLPLKPGSVPVIYDKLGFTAKEMVASHATLGIGEDGRMYANMWMIEIDNYETSFQYSLPLYGHELGG